MRGGETSGPGSTIGRMPAAEHLGFIQAVIARMAQNCFLIRGWSVTLTAALIGLAAADDERAFAWIAVGAVSVFALLDARYLALEHEFVALYDRAAAAAVTDWSLAAHKPTAADIARAAVSWSVALPHGAALVAALAVAVMG